MILQALKEYYDRLARDPASDIPRFGYSREKISWAIVIDREGNLVPPILDLRHSIFDEKKKKERKISREMNVPTTTATASRSGTDPPSNFLWDNTAFVLGAKEKPGDRDRYFQKFKKLHHQIGETLDDEGIQAVLKFLDRWLFEDTTGIENWDEISGGNLVFRLDGDHEFIHQRSKIKEMWEQYIQTQEAEIAKEDKKNYEGACLLTGDVGTIARIHRQIKGIKEPNGLRDAQSTGGSFIGFQDAKTAFCSYGMDHRQSFNSPVSILAAFAYTTALNWLLRSGSDQKIQIADATTIYWAERPTRMEQSLYYLFNPPSEKADGETEDDPGKAAELKVFLNAVRQGKFHDIGEDENVKFYILGLSPNAVRISVRFWHVSTVGEIAEKIGKHFRNIHIEKHFPNESEYPGMWQILRETALQKKIENVSPLLGGELMRSILTGRKYPESLLAAVIGRFRADQEVNYYRISLVKGCLVRNYNKEVSVSLNKQNTVPSYLLGRLFAVLEKAQEDASGGQLNSTIKDRYFSSASATPRAVFPILLRLNQHHVSKGEHGGYYTHLIGDIMEFLPAEKLPTHMPLDDQGLFAIGYYHQRNDFFKKHDRNESSATAE